MFKNILVPTNHTKKNEKALDIAVHLDSGKEDRIDGSESIDEWATISYRVGIYSHCPVLIVK